MEQIIRLLTEYRYFILFPLAIVEGPILAVVAGSLSSNGLLNPLFCYPIIVSGDLVGDSCCYALGRWGRRSAFAGKIVKRIGLRAEKMDRIRVFFESNPARTISLSKIVLGIGMAGIVMAGNAKVPYYRFLKICLLTSAIQYIVYLGAGILFGQAYIRINHYLNYFASISTITMLALLLFFIIQSKLRKL